MANSGQGEQHLRILGIQVQRRHERSLGALGKSKAQADTSQVDMNGRILGSNLGGLDVLGMSLRKAILARELPSDGIDHRKRVRSLGFGLAKRLQCRIILAFRQFSFGTIQQWSQSRGRRGTAATILKRPDLLQKRLDIHAASPPHALDAGERRLKAAGL